jgi:tRNA(adenine34) deaminase
MLDEEYMEMCLDEARAAWDEEEVPVGALVADASGAVIARAHNITRLRTNPTAHAEMVALEEASRRRGNYRLTGCTLFVTMEPCIMCAGAIIEARIERLVFGCYDDRRGAFGSVIDVNALPLNHKVKVSGGILKDESAILLKQFFTLRRGTEVAITGPTRNRLYV